MQGQKNKNKTYKYRCGGGKSICLPIHIYYCSYLAYRISHKLQSGLINSQWRQVDDYSMEWIMINDTIQTQKQYYICVL